MNKKEIEFEFETATKNIYRFQKKIIVSPAIGTLYAQKAVSASTEQKKVNPPRELHYLIE